MTMIKGKAPVDFFHLSSTSHRSRRLTTNASGKITASTILLILLEETQTMTIFLMSMKVLICNGKLNVNINMYLYQPMRGASIKLWIGLKGTKFNLLWLRYNFIIYQIDVFPRFSNSPLLSKTPSGWHGWASWLWQLQGWHKLLFSLVLKFFWYSAWY